MDIEPGFASRWKSKFPTGRWPWSSARQTPRILRFLSRFRV